MISGWDQEVPTGILFQQLDHCLVEKDYDKVDKLLLRIKTRDHPQLQSKACILGCHRNYLSPQRSFRPDSMLTLYPLAPYIDEVDRAFARKHATLLAALDIQHEPSIEDLRYVQESLDRSNQGQLNDSDLHIAITTLEISSRLGYDPIKLHIPDTTSTLRNLPDIVHGDRNLRGGISSFNFTHPRVSEHLIKRLEIEDSLERAIRLDVDFDDGDEDEYTQRESLSTVICDTLGRYPIETTFNEFLANADDAGATRLSWTIDTCQAGPHKSDSLLAPELKPFQGAALIAYNDGTFSEKDFAGFKDIGQGGKGDDATTTGMFGRGALSMYHFTDVPMIISGGYYLVLDPQQERLPRNKYYKRKAGVKIPLATAHRVAVDQLTPLDGLYGYDKSIDFFNGTIFRFPFRILGTKTTLKDAAQCLDLRMTRVLLEDYFQTARVSLLFLHNVKDLEFRIRGEDYPKWKISAHRPEGSENEVFQRVIIKSAKEGHQTETDVWQVGLTDIEQSPAGVVKVGKGSSKITDCGIAACLQHGAWDSDIKSNDEKVPSVDLHKSPMKCVDQRIFCRLPTNSESQLPVSVHASFAITGDRKTIAFEDNSEISAWNRWLLTDCLPRFYLEFLTALSSKLGEDAFRFWPSAIAEESSPTLSGAVAKGFWTNIFDPDHEAHKIYPVVQSHHLRSRQDLTSNDLRRGNVQQSRKLHKTTTLKLGQFDCLPNSVSMKLRPLLAKLCPNLVRLPLRVWKQFRVPGLDGCLTEIGPKYLCQLFREEDNCRTLERFVAELENIHDKIAALRALFQIITPEIEEEDPTPMYILIGCRILPRPVLEVPFGILTLDGSSEASCNLIATAEEQALFSFANDAMINTGLLDAKKPGKSREQERNPIVNMVNARFNIRYLAIADLGSLLERHNSPAAPSAPSHVRGEWLPKFWLYVNGKFLPKSDEEDVSGAFAKIEDLLSNAGLHNQAVYRVGSDDGWRYLSPCEFDANPCIIKPLSPDQQAMCADIPGLNLADPGCLPYLLSEMECDLNQLTSFRRFLRALEKIGQMKGVKIKTFVDELTDAAKETLRDLLSKFMSGLPQSEDVPYKSVLRALPVWPRLNHSEHNDLPKHIAAEDARFFSHRAIFMPWMKDLESFVDPDLVEEGRESLSRLDIKLTTVEEFWHYTKKDIPSNIVVNAWTRQYLRLFKTLAKNGVKPTGKVAPDSNGTLCGANSLYDHEDDIFRAAFRGEESKRFLHPDLRELRYLWLSVGLRARPPSQEMSSEDIIECALALDKRWKPSGWNQIFNQDASLLSGYLHHDRPEFHAWAMSTWDQISKARVFEVEDRFEHQHRYRRARMLQIGQQHYHTALKDASRPSDVRIVWSQLKALKQPPDTGVFDKLPNRGSPLTETVYQHLQFLISICKEVSQSDLQEYLKDIQACYNHFQDNNDSARALHDIWEAQIWFNFDTSQVDVVRKAEVEASLTSTKLLCLNTPCKEPSISFMFRDR